MDSRRRSFLGLIVPGTLVAGLGFAQSQYPPELRRPSRRRDDPAPSAPKPDPRAQLKQVQKDLQRDVQRLFGLAEQLKKEVEKENLADVLPLSFVRKAEEIEKLARRIKNLARG